MLQERMMIVNNRIKNQKGISLISLIITIIVIIILAAIVIFEGFGATESAEFARFTQEFSGYQEEISQEYRSKKTNNAIGKIRKKDSEIYSEMGSSAGTVNEVLGEITLQESLKGTNCYRLTLDRKIYDENESVYVTDKGEVFSLPGYEYKINGETRYYVTSSKYYIGDGTVLPDGDSGENSDGGGTSTDEPVEMTGAPTVVGTIAVGDYVDYLPDEASYENNDVPDGKDAKDYYLGSVPYPNDPITTDLVTKWRVVRINESTGEVLITAADGVDCVAFRDGPGYLNSVRILDYICRKLYSNNNLGTKARCMRIEDLDYTTSSNVRYAYYSNSAIDTPNVTVNGVTYEGKRHEDWEQNSSYASNKDQNIKFWDYDKGTDEECIKEIELNGETYRYATPSGDKPVLVTGKNAVLSSGTESANAINVLDINGYLASTRTELRDTNVYFKIYLAGRSGVSNLSLVGSNGYICMAGYRMHPIVTLGSGLKMEATGVGDTGSPENPWKITKLN